MAQRGYSRDHRSDCKQIVLALVVSREGFPLAHQTFAGNTQDLQTVEAIVTTIEKRFGKSQRVWVMDRGMISEESLAILSKPGRRYLLATRRGEGATFQEELGSGGWQRLDDKAGKAIALTNLARSAHYQGEYDRAARLYREGEALWRALGALLAVELCGVRTLPLLRAG